MTSLRAYAARMTDRTKYHPLFEQLLFSGQGSVLMSFSEIEAIIGERLPPSARKREEWWSNSPSGHSQARAWMRANYRASKVNLTGETVMFVLEGWPEGYRLMNPGFSGSRPASGMGENPQAPFEQTTGKGIASDVADHPLFGVWKGKVTLLPDHDYAKPAFDDRQ
jgi:hypothetical protein